PRPSQAAERLGPRGIDPARRQKSARTGGAVALLGREWCPAAWDNEVQARRAPSAAWPTLPPRFATRCPRGPVFADVAAGWFELRWNSFHKLLTGADCERRFILVILVWVICPDYPPYSSSLSLISNHTDSS